MKNQILVVGTGRFGTVLASTLSELGNDVMVIDKDEKAVEQIAPMVTHAVQADATSIPALKELGAGNFDIAIVTIGSNIENSILATILLKRSGVPKVIARANNSLHGEILKKIGADKVIYPEKEIGEKVGFEATLGDITGYMSLTSGYGIVKIEARPQWVGHSLSDLKQVKGQTGIAILLIHRKEEVIVTPNRNHLIEPADLLILSGSNESLADFLEKDTLDQGNGKTDSG